jgi:hypothetical protein
MMTGFNNKDSLEKQKLLTDEIAQHGVGIFPLET